MQIENENVTKKLSTKLWLMQQQTEFFEEQRNTLQIT